MLRRTLLASIAFGLLAGSLIAVLVPETRPAPSIAAGDRAAQSGGAAPSVATVRRVAPARPSPKGLEHDLLRAAGPIAVEARVADPRGGPEWAVRSFLAHRISRIGIHGRARRKVLDRERCFQLGRLHGGRFGWLTSDGTFRPARIDLDTVPTTCASPRPDLGGSPFANVVSTITDPDRPAAEVLQTIVWGAVGAAGRPRLSVDAASSRLAVGRHGGLLAVLPPSVGRRQTRLTVDYPGGDTRVLLPADAEGSRHPMGMLRGRQPELAAQAPDPDGGLPHALLVSMSDEEICTLTGPRVVGDRFGSPDYALDLLRAYGAVGGSCSPRRDSRPRGPDGRPLAPWQLGTSFGGDSAGFPGGDPSTGRIARRTLPGRVVLAGIVDPDVASLTIASPSDVRTLVPAGPARAVIAVYGGTFATGTFDITTTFKDGRTRRDELGAGL